MKQAGCQKIGMWIWTKKKEITVQSNPMYYNYCSWKKMWPVLGKLVDNNDTIHFSVNYPFKNPFFLVVKVTEELVISRLREHHRNEPNTNCIVESFTVWSRKSLLLFVLSMLLMLSAWWRPRWMWWYRLKCVLRVRPMPFSLGRSTESPAIDRLLFPLGDTFFLGVDESSP